MLNYPRTIDPGLTFNQLVKWFEFYITVRRCPGVLVGLSGTDSLVTFCAAYQAFKNRGQPSRVWGIHFAPSEALLDHSPETNRLLWFSKEIIPWLQKYAPEATITVDSTIDGRYDGLRWGKMADMAVIYEDRIYGRNIRKSQDKYWVSGTTNRSEVMLFNYSNASQCVSLQPLVHLWKSEVLQIAEYLNLPKLAIQKSCEVDCICGREALRAEHPRELDFLLMNRAGELRMKYIFDNIPEELFLKLDNYIEERKKAAFKEEIPYTPPKNIVKPLIIDNSLNSILIADFEQGTLNLRTFDHIKHMYIAWEYLRSGMPLQDAINRYSTNLKKLLDVAGYSSKFSQSITEDYFNKLNIAMKNGLSFEELWDENGMSIL